MLMRKNDKSRKSKGLSVNFFSVACSDNKNSFNGWINFVYDSVITVSERIATFFVAFQRFSGIWIFREGTYAF